MAASTTKRPGVGVGVIVTSKNHAGCVLIGRRRGKVVGTGLYSLPGGHLEFGEEWVDCAKRETLEETGLALINVTFGAVVNGAFPSERYHFLELVMRGEVDMNEPNEPRNMEPEKCEGWEWRRPDELPPQTELFPALRAFIRAQVPPFDLALSTSHQSPLIISTNRKSSENHEIASSNQETSQTVVNSPKRPGVGVGVIVTSKNHAGCVLIGRRRGKVVGTGLYSLPGGHLEFGEDWAECARREIMEETGLSLNSVNFVGATNGILLSMNYHYITIVMSGEVDTNRLEEPRNMEPEKCEGWEWRRQVDFPSEEDMFPALRAIIRDNIPPFNVGQR